MKRIGAAKSLTPWSLNVNLVIPLMAKHIVKLRYLRLATFFGRRLFKIAVATNVLNDAFAVELLL